MNTWPIFVADLAASVSRQAILSRAYSEILASWSFRRAVNLYLAGLALYRARPDKGYSLTDCISIQTMRREGLTDALTNDRHFEQEGVRALFRR